MRGSTPLGRSFAPSRLTPVTLAMRPAYYFVRHGTQRGISTLQRHGSLTADDDPLWGACDVYFSLSKLLFFYLMNVRQLYIDNA